MAKYFERLDWKSKVKRKSETVNCSDSEQQRESQELVETRVGWKSNNQEINQIKLKKIDATGCLEAKKERRH